MHNSSHKISATSKNQRILYEDDGRAKLCVLAFKGSCTLPARGWVRVGEFLLSLEASLSRGHSSFATEDYLAFAITKNTIAGILGGQIDEWAEHFKWGVSSELTVLYGTTF